MAESDDSKRSVAAAAAKAQFDLFRAGGPRPDPAGNRTEAAPNRAPAAEAAGPPPVRRDAPRVLTVTELTRDLKGTLESRFARVNVRGEVSNFKPAASGHLYFTLKDDGACIGAVLFRNDAARLKFQVKDGLLVVARGRLSVYEPRGQYQLICDGLEPEGAGALALAFEQLKQKLAKEGLFDPARKRPIPFLPRRIGLVTSPHGAAIRDFLRVLHDRFPLPVLLVPARVQGEGAAEEIARAVTRLGRSGLVDVIVVTRGGGSIEDLWSFNEEVVARAIAASPVPVVSAVGHEVDFTISDFVADKRCATPTDAAKTLAPIKDELLKNLDKHRRHLRDLWHRAASRASERLAQRRARLVDPRRQIAHHRLRLDHDSERTRRALAQRIGDGRRTLANLSERLAAAHPRARLAQSANRLDALRQRLVEALRRKLAAEAGRAELAHRKLLRLSPQPLLAREHRRVTALNERAARSVRALLHRERLRSSRAAAGLDGLSPLRVLERGYSITFAGDAVLKRAEDVRAGEAVRVVLSDRSEVEATVVATRPSAAGSTGDR